MKVLSFMLYLTLVFELLFSEMWTCKAFPNYWRIFSLISHPKFRKDTSYSLNECTRTSVLPLCWPSNFEFGHSIGISKCSTVYQNVVQYIKNVYFFHKNVHEHSEWRKSERITSLSLTSILTKVWNILHNFQNPNTTHHTLAEILND